MIRLKAIRGRLLNLAIGELAAACVFVFAYRQLTLGTASLIALLYLLFVLLQGSAYWLYRYAILGKGRNAIAKAIPPLRFLRYLNILLLATQ